MTNLLAIDLGTTTGFCYNQGKDIISDTKNFKPKRYEGGGMRYFRFEKWLKAILEEGKPAYVYFEEVRAHNGVNAAHIYGGFMSSVSRICEEFKIPYSGVAVGTIKKHISGRGDASKDRVKQAVELLLGIKPKDDNEADAIAIWHYAKEILHPDAPS